MSENNKRILLLSITLNVTLYVLRPERASLANSCRQLCAFVNKIQWNGWTLDLSVQIMSLISTLIVIGGHSRDAPLKRKMRQQKWHWTLSLVSQNVADIASLMSAIFMSCNIWSDSLYCDRTTHDIHGNNAWLQVWDVRGPGITCGPGLVFARTVYTIR